MKYTQSIILSGLFIAIAILFSSTSQPAPKLVYACVPVESMPTGECAVFGEAPVIAGSCVDECIGQIEVPDGPPEYLAENVNLGMWAQMWYQPMKLECVSWSTTCQYDSAPCITPVMSDPVICPVVPEPTPIPTPIPDPVPEPTPTPEPVPDSVPDPVIPDPIIDITSDTDPEPTYSNCGATTIESCTLGASVTSLTPYDGVCTPGTGSCQYTCFNGVWVEYNNSNTCGMQDPTITTSKRDVRINTPITLEYNTGGYTCSLRVGNTTLVPNLPVTGSYPVTVQAQTTYVLDCDGSVDPSVTVRILPKSFET